MVVEEEEQEEKETEQENRQLGMKFHVFTHIHQSADSLMDCSLQQRALFLS